jgi:hypothetical protein
MASDETLLMFVRDALSRGLSRTQIEDALRKAGWTVEQIKDALGRFADVEFPIPVPRARAQLNARETYLYLVQFLTLYVSAYNLAALLFDIINWAIPDPAQSSNLSAAAYLRGSIRWELSSLIVAFPVFLYMSWVIGASIRRDPNKRHSKIRRNLTYLSLFVAASTLICDVITLVYNVLGGELTVRFFLKVATVGVIAGTAFGYYLLDLRREELEATR